jgi:hypothetical protein
MITEKPIPSRQRDPWNKGHLIDGIGGDRADKGIECLCLDRVGHDALVDISAAKQMTFTGTREELRERLAQLEARGATGIIFGTSGYDVERELRAYAEVAGLR